jgi:hypothetical protein
MCEALIIPALIASTALSATAAYNQGQTAKKTGRNNQIMAEYAAQDAMARGDEAAIAAQRRTAQLRGTQRASMAASGLDLSFGTPADLIDQTDFFGQIDANTARDNAKREAWSSRAQGANARAQGNAAAKQGNLAAAGSILGGAAQAADKWYTLNPAGDTTAPGALFPVQGPTPLSAGSY